MAFTPMNGRCTGFEMGTVDLSPIGVPAAWTGAIYPEISSVDKHTGTYAMRMRSHGIYRIYLEPGLTEVYFGLWYKLDHIPVPSLAGYHYISVYYDNGEFVQFKINYQAMWDARKYHLDIAGNAVLDYTIYGTIPVTVDWHHFAARVKVDNTGAIETIIDGIPDITNAGDTLYTGSPTLQRVEIWHENAGQYDSFADYSYWDDISIGTGGFPQDYRYEVLKPVSDVDITGWTPSTGATGWDLIDDIPPDDADYISTITDDAEAIMELENWNGTDKDPAFVQFWARAQKDEAQAHKLAFINSDGVASDPGPAQDLLVSPTYIGHIFTTAPDATPWTEAHINALHYDVKATIV